MKISVVCALALVAGSAAADSVLFDTRPTASSSSGYTVGTSLGFSVYQPFNVTDADGWDVSRIWLDGWNVSGSGQMLVDLAVDDTSAPLASTMITFTNTDGGKSEFVGGDISVFLPGNASYVMRIHAEDSSVWNALFFGSSGPHSHSIDAAGQHYDNDNSISTYIEGRVAPAPAGLGLIGLGGLAGTRRRR